ncbi:MAG TPA: UDP-N-acetylglucosamine 2-epimerase, partial [Planctomycetota bacterium]|nr:UDP-N-acetylglucosamine 2-epimerase [Planctomycetota bacterium]
MLRLLVVTGSCSEAFELAGVVRALRASGAEAKVAWFGSDAALAEAHQLGLPHADFVHRLPAGAGPAVRYVEAVRFAAELLATGEWSGVLTAGCDTWALAAGTVANQVGTAVVRLGAGQRGAAADRTQQRRRLADHTGTAWFVATEMQARQLQSEGLPSERMRVVGSLLPEALRALPAPPTPSAPFVWLAIEHAQPVDDRVGLAALLAGVADAARSVSLPVRAAATVLGPALERLALALPEGITLANGAGARAQLDAARTARVLLTDSAGHQDLAAAAGVPCVVLPGSPVRTDLVASGACRLWASPTELATTLAQAIASPPRAHTAPPALATLLAELPVLLAPPTFAGPNGLAAPAPAAGLGLPSDADASGRTLGEDEVALAAAAIRSGTLNSTRGTFVTAFERRFAEWLGSRHAIACASGSAAVHCAI